MDLCHIPFITSISGSPTQNKQRKPILAHLCPLCRPTQGRKTDARCLCQAHGNFSLAETTSYACPLPTSVLFCLPGRRLLTHPKPEYCYSPVLSTNPFIQRSTFYTGLMPPYFLSQLRVISLQTQQAVSKPCKSGKPPRVVAEIFLSAARKAYFHHRICRLSFAR